MPTAKKVLREVFPILVALGVFAGVLGIPASPGNSPAADRAVTAVAYERNSLLTEGAGDTAAGYFEATSPALVAAAAGEDDATFYDLGELLVADGLSHAIIEPGREMNGAWYEWSENRAPPSEPDAYVLAWRPEPGHQPYQLADYPDAVAALERAA
jgi:hypothetical protein